MILAIETRLQSLLLSQNATPWIKEQNSVSDKNLLWLLTYSKNWKLWIYFDLKFTLNYQKSGDVLLIIGHHFCPLPQSSLMPPAGRLERYGRPALEQVSLSLSVRPPGGLYEAGRVLSRPQTPPPSTLDDQRRVLLQRVQSSLSVSSPRRLQTRCRLLLDLRVTHALRCMR